MIKLEHIGIAVNNLAVSIPLFEKLLNTTCYKKEVVTTEMVSTAFFQKRDIKVELLESLHPDGVISKYIQKKGEGIHHLAFEVENIGNEVERLKAEGFVFINETPKKGADNKLICFLHPKETNHHKDQFVNNAERRWGVVGQGVQGVRGFFL